MLANFTSHHAETILLNHFKPCAIGVTARLNPLQNASPVSILRCSIDSVVLRALRNQEEEGTKYLKEGDLQSWSWLALACKCLLVVLCAFDVKVRERICIAPNILGCIVNTIVTSSLMF